MILQKICKMIKRELRIWKCIFQKSWKKWKNNFLEKIVKIHLTEIFKFKACFTNVYKNWYFTMLFHKARKHPNKRNTHSTNNIHDLINNIVQQPISLTLNFIQNDHISYQMYDIIYIINLKIKRNQKCKNIANQNYQS